MSDFHRLAEIAALVGDPARASMLAELLSGRAHTAGELAAVARITPQTASAHLAKLSEARLIKLARQGRHRYAALASPAVARMLESMQLVADAERRPCPEPRIQATLKRARTCYDHLAGELGVALCDALVARGQVICADESAELTDAGVAFAAQLGLTLEGHATRRPLCRVCLDWSERRSHLAGRFGASLAEYFFEQRWIQRARQGRAVQLTAAGERALLRHFGVSLLEPGKIPIR
jgi:DNA-binding transcriptional ArsR family regulator